jgi:transcriptional regulator with XRE-family HTH domain
MRREVSVAFGQRLSELCAERGVSKRELALRAGVHTTAIRRFERGAREPRLTSILLLAEGLDVTPGTLLDALARRERRLTPEEFERHFGQLPADGEG